MKTEFKTCLINCLLAIVIALFFSLSDGLRDFVPVLGITCVIWSVISFFVSVILFVARTNHVAKGIMLSAGILILMGFTTCSTYI